MRKLFVFLVLGALLLAGGAGLRTALSGEQAGRIQPALAEQSAGAASGLPRCASVNWGARVRTLGSTNRPGAGGYGHQWTFRNDFYESIKAQPAWGLGYTADGFVQLEEREMVRAVPVSRTDLFTVIKLKWRYAII